MSYNQIINYLNTNNIKYIIKNNQLIQACIAGMYSTSPRKKNKMKYEA